MSKRIIKSKENSNTEVFFCITHNDSL